MKSIGIVAEYNPFHNGHQYQIETTKKLTGADIIIVVMSGNFLQRGEPALVSKWSRAKMALQQGADIVIELPYSFAVQKAETFAYGSVYLLNALKCNGICFGSESGKMDEFTFTKHFIQDHREQYESYVRTFIKQGMSYPSALQSAYLQLEPSSKVVDLTKPNNILGYHYVTAASEINPQMTFYTVKRKNAEHHDDTFLDSTIASATSIRKSLHAHTDLDEIKSYIPVGSLYELERYYSNYGQFHSWNDYWPFLQFRLLSMKSEELKEIYEVEEGLEHRLIRNARTATSFQSFMAKIKTKRYTWTRLQRVCVHILTNTKKKTIHSLEPSPHYIRLLGMNGKGRKYLGQIKKELPIPLISKVSSYQDGMLALDLKAADLYAHGLAEPYRSILFKLEFNQPPIILNM